MSVKVGINGGNSQFSRQRKPFGNNGGNSSLGGFGGGVGTNSLGKPMNIIDTFSKEVLEAIISDNIPPIPSNYQIYFHRLLDEKPEDLKKQIQQVIDVEENIDAEENLSLKIEERLREEVQVQKKMLNLLSTFYKNTNLMSDLMKKRTGEIVQANNNPLLVQNIVELLNKDVDKLSTVTKQQASVLKELHTQSSDAVKAMQEDSIYDSTYGIYNKRFLLKQLEKEKTLIKQFNHLSSIMLLKVSKNTIKIVNNEKIVGFASKTISKLLFKTSRRNDVVAYYENGVFALILKHTSLISAKRTAERLRDLVNSTNFFWGDKDIKLDVTIGISNINQNRSIENSLDYAYRALELTDITENKFMAVCDEDEALAK